MGDRAVVAAWVGSSNLGDELVFSVMQGLLADRGVRTVVSSINPVDTTTSHSVEAFNHLNPWSLHARLRTSRAMVFGGGGLLQDETGIWNVPWHLSRIKAAQRTRTPWAGIGLGAAGLTSRRSQRQVAATLVDHVAITTRDRRSTEVLERLGVPRLVQATDLAWLANRPNRLGSGVLAVCLRNPQTAWWRPGALGPQARTNEATLNALAAAIDAAATATGLLTRFVALDSSADHPLHEQVAERMDTPAEIRRPDLSGLLSAFADTEAVIAMRYHGAIAAAMAGASVVVLPFSPKLSALIEDLGPSAVESEGLDDLPRAVVAALAGGKHQPEGVERLIHLAAGNVVALEELLEAS